MTAGSRSHGSSDTPASGQTREQLANATGFRLTLRAKSPQIKTEPVLVEFTIQNVAKRMLLLEDTFPERHYEIAVRNSQDQEVSLTERGRTLRANKGEDFRVVAVRLKPGEQKIDMIDVGSLFDLSAPGVYTVHATRRVKKLSSIEWTHVESNKVKIQVD
jgi:hypothetical protein